MSRPSFSIVLPARYASTRFPGKPLAVVSGRPLIEWVYRRAETIDGAAEVLVATDDERIASAVRGFGGNVVMTRGDHATGTDRVAEVARSLESDIVVNLQGDEPVFNPVMVEEMVDRMGADDRFDIMTACHRIDDPAELQNPNVVKVSVDDDGRALGFSRAAIPGAPAMRHVGVYAFRRDAVLRFSQLEPTALERSERLEQLRALEHGMTIGVVETDQPTVGVDVPGDLKSVEKHLASNYTD